MTDAAETREVDVDEARRRMLEGALLLDVREPDEWVEGHAPDAQHVPMAQVAGSRADLPNDRTILAICRSGARSARIAAALNSWGYDAVNVAGGMQAWAAHGYTVVTDGGSPGRVA
ncbi:MAG: rhodanese-like domain-containing protein [Actinobacteria bacterium]|nr:rhodanese-like domain-containing protein [Actinomycetota bacterium]